MEETPLEGLRQELNRTAVISEEFKKAIMAWAHVAVRDAYERGAASVVPKS